MAGLHSGDSDAASSDGYVVLSVAENKMSFGPLRAKLEDHGAVPESAAQYTNMRGVDRFRDAVAATMERTCLKGATVDPNCLCVQAGCGALVSTLITLLAEDGDAVITPSPAYPAFDNDVSVLAGAHLEHAPMVVPGVWTPGPSSSPPEQSEGDLAADSASGSDWSNLLSVSALEAAAKRAESAGHRPRVLLLAHPNNPMGLITPPEQVLAAIRWARGRGMHVISDEIYANSVHTPGITGAGGDTGDKKGAEAGAAAGSKSSAIAPVPMGAASFTSALQMLHDEAEAGGAAGGEKTEAASGALGPLGLDVHVLWGFSKDFALSGYRVGALLTHNPALLQALDNVSYFAAVSNDTQHRLAACLEDPAFTDGYLDGCRRDVRGNCDALSTELQAAGIPFVAPRAGLFAVVDLRALLPLPAAAGAGKGGIEEKEEAGASGESAGSNGLLPASAYRGERMLQDRVFSDCKVVLTPGEAMHAPVPGLFRACFAWMPPASIRAGVRRLGELKKVIEEEKAAGKWVVPEAAD